MPARLGESMIFLVRTIAGALGLAALVAAGVSAWAGESKWSDSGKARVRLIAAGAAAPAAPIRAGIEIRLASGWHTYWRYAGDAGIPPRFDWSHSTNLARAEILWPAPQRIALEDGIESIGYNDSVLLPVRLTPRDPAKPIGLRLRIDFGICEKICVPASAEAALEIAPGAGLSLPSLDRAEAQVPVKSEIGTGSRPGIAAVALQHGGTAVTVDVDVPAGKSFDLFADDPADGWSPPLPKRKSFKNGRARFVIALGERGAVPPAKNLRLTLVSGEESIEVVAPLD